MKKKTKAPEAKSTKRARMPTENPKDAKKAKPIKTKVTQVE